jgi:HAD superfamily phosphoserine phosphatase-like hydrolase
MEQEKLIVFDVEGVIIPKGHFLLKLFQLYKPHQIPQLILYGFLYFTGLIPIKKAVEKIFKMLKSLPEDSVSSVVSEIPLKPGTLELFANLKAHDYKTALISSGIPQHALNSIALKLGVDFAVGLVLDTDNGLLTGEVSGLVLEKDGKSQAVEILKQKNDLNDYSIVAIADDRNNIPLFKNSSLRIGYYPDFALQFYSDHVVEGKLTKLLPIITGENLNKPTKITRNTVLRKTVHASSILIPLLLIDLIGKQTVISLLILAIVLYITAETFRVLGTSFPVFTWFTLLNITDSEASEFVDAPIFFALGIALPLIFFPEDIAYASIAVLALGDSVAAIMGMLLGRHSLPLFKQKSVEGTLFGLVSAYFGALLFLDPWNALIAAIIGTTVEALPSPFNDNLIIPIAAGLAVLLI